MAKLSNLIDQIDSGSLLLPEFQRGYVWNRDQVRGLMRSLHLGYPVGSLLIWETETDGTTVRGDGGTAGVRQLLLDGQQRITSLYGVVRGEAPAFFEGDSTAFTGLMFNVRGENFEFYAPAKMRDDPHWVDVTNLFRDGLQPAIADLNTHPDTQPHIVVYMERLVRLRSILEREFHAEKITGHEKTVDVVVDIFNRVNSGGTKLSKGDLALAKICAEWPDARSAMRSHLARWKQAGFDFKLDWLLRNATATATGRAEFSSLEDVSASDFERALEAAAGYVGHFLDVVSGRLGLDHDRVLMARYAFPVVSRLLHLSGGQFADTAERDRVLFWYVHAALWGRFTGSTETVLDQDYKIAQAAGVGGLIEALERWRGGNLQIGDHDFVGFGRGSRFYPLLYLLTRVRGARDLGSGLELKAEMLGRLSGLQVHHIFPKTVLYKSGYNQNQVNAVANFCFLTQESNLKIGKRLPDDYFAEAEARHPGVLASQWIPDDPALWQVDRYTDFLAARRELLAAAANDFLAELRTGAASSTAPRLEVVSVADEETDETDARVTQVKELVTELIALGCAEPDFDAEIADPENGKELAIAEAYWPDGLQPGQGPPVVLELDPTGTNLDRLDALGYHVFTSPDALLDFVRRRNAQAAGVAEEEAVPPPAPSEDRSVPDTELRREFEGAMRGVYDGALGEAGYRATYFLSMLGEHGGLETARRLLAAPRISDGFAALWERNRLDLTVEALVVQPRFAELFTDEEIDTARQRLAQFGQRA